MVIDKATGELAERIAFQTYGATESDYRPARWKGFREDYRFTGKEEDIEVGLTYFGRRFLSTPLGRWLSPDPLAVHQPLQGDLNLYAYVRGRTLRALDPLGLDDVMIVAMGAVKDSPRVQTSNDPAYVRASPDEAARNMQRFAEQWRAGEKDRHIVYVAENAKRADIVEAFKTAVRLVGEGGKVVLSVGHGSGDGEPWFQLTPSSNGNGLDVTQSGLASVLRGSPGVKTTQSDKDLVSVGALREIGKVLTGSKVSEVELLTCTVGKTAKEQPFLKDLATTLGKPVAAHSQFVASGVLTQANGKKVVELEYQRDKGGKFEPVRGTQTTKELPTRQRVGPIMPGRPQGS